MPSSREFLEKTAAQVVAVVLGGDWELHDTQGRSGAYDFTITTRDAVAALEVTQATDQTTERLFTRSTAP